MNGEKIRGIRKRLRLTQAAFARELGVSPWTVRGWEQGRFLPSGPARILLEAIEMSQGRKR